MSTFPPDSRGEKALAWVRDHSPVLESYRDDYAESLPFGDATVAVSAPLTPHTGVFIETLHAGGAEVLFCGEPDTNHGAVIEELDALDGVEAFVEEGMDADEYGPAQDALLEREPDVIFDDGCALIARVHDRHPEIAKAVSAGCEQTTAGITRLEAMDRENALEFPVYSVNDTPMKRFFDNVHGTSESIISSLSMTTNTMISGETVVIAGYGYCGRGLARKLRGMGAQTVVTEADPRNALEAHMHGHRVMTMAEAASEGDYFVAITGSQHVIREEHFERMADGAVVASGGTASEIDVGALAETAERETEPKEGITRYHFDDGRHVNLLTGGYVVNLAAPGAAGNPAEVMDLTFATMSVAASDMLERTRDPGLYALPDELDRAIAERKLETLGIEAEERTEDQAAYADDWRRT